MIAQLAAGIVANLQRITPEVQALPGPIAQPTPPTIWPIIPGEMQYGIAMGAAGGNEMACTVQGFVPFTDDLGNLATLYAWMDASGAGSVSAALEYDRTLGGAAEDLNVVSVAGPTLATIGSGSVLLSEWQVTIYVVTP